VGAVACPQSGRTLTLVCFGDRIHDTAQKRNRLGTRDVVNFRMKSTLEMGKVREQGKGSKREARGET
jgi:hypothetical protein